MNEICVNLKGVNNILMGERISQLVNSKYFYYVLLALLTGVAIWNHFFCLTDIPQGLHVDEAGLAYDTWSIANFGVDRYLMKNPIYLTNYGGGSSVMALYLAVLVLKLLGGGAEYMLIAVRIPCAVMGIVTIIFGHRLFCELLGKWKGLVGTTLLVICPYFMMQSRFGLDCNYMLNFCTLSLYFLVRAIKYSKRRYWCLTGIFMGLTLYTYAISYAVILLFVVTLILLLAYMRKLKFSELLLMGIPMGIIALPIVTFVIINYFKLPTIETPFFTIPMLTGFRGGEFTLDPASIVNNIKAIVASLFFHDWIDYNAFPQYGTLYIISVPFMIAGILASMYRFVSGIGKKEYHQSMPITLFFTVAICFFMFLGGDGPNINKMNSIFVAAVYFTAVGICLVYKKLTKLQKPFLVVLVLCYSVCFVTFEHTYFTQDQELYLFEKNCAQAIEVVENRNQDKNVYYDFNTQGYIYYLISKPVSPYDFLVESGMDHYQNNYFELPDGIEPEACYVVKRSNETYIEALEGVGLFTKEPAGDYYVFY